MNKTIIAFVFAALVIPSTLFAQTVGSSTPQNVTTLIAELQAKIKELQLQLVALQTNTPADEPTASEADSLSALTQTLSRGMSNDHVADLQRYLAKHPDIYPEGLITGYFGALTEQAVKRLQQASGLEPVGIVGPKTRSVINDEIVSSSGGSGGAVASPVQATSPTTIVVPTTSVSAATPTSTTTSNPSTGVYYGSYTGGGLDPRTPTFYSEPHPASSPPPPPEATSSDATSTTPAPPPPPSDDVTGPTITSLSITPLSTVPGGQVAFTATAEDPSGINTIIYDIKYPGTTYTLRPNCNFNGVTSGTCAFGESIDHGIKDPTLLGDYVIISVRIIDTIGNTATYYPDGTVAGGSSGTHSLTIPAVTIMAP